MNWLKDLFADTHYFEVHAERYYIYKRKWWQIYGRYMDIMTTDRKYAVWQVNFLNGVES